MENGKVVIKAKFNGDIRRMTVDDAITYKELKKLLKKLYRIPFFRINYVDDEADLITINSDMDLQNAVKQTKGTKFIRLSIEQLEAPSKASLTSSMISDEREPLLDNSFIDQLFHQPSFREKLEQVVVQTLTTPPVLNTIAQNVIENLNAPNEAKPYLGPKSKSLDTFGFGSFIMDSVPQMGNETSVEVNKALSEVFDTKTPLDVASIESEPVPIVREISFEEQQRELPEKETLEESKNFVENEEGEGEESEESEIPEFVVVDNSNIQDDLNSSKLSPFRSLISMVRSVVNRRESEQDVIIPNLDELLLQLSEMGFNDKECNIKALKFHKRYNEGLHEVVEDLLLQSSQINDENNINNNSNINDMHEEQP